MNYVNCIIQILEIPAIQFCKNNVPTLKFSIRLPPIKNKIPSSTIIEGIVWGNLASDIGNYYRINDYVLAEGYISIIFNTKSNKTLLIFNILKLYPFSFSFNLEI